MTMTDLRRFGTVAFDLEVMRGLIGMGWIQQRENGDSRILKPCSCTPSEQP